MMIYKTIFFLPFLLFGNFLKSQVTISINSKKKIDTLTFQINQFDKLILLVNNKNQVSRICNVKNGKLDGFQYYLNMYFMDSIVKYSNDLPTKERYINSKNGQLSEIHQYDGSILDTTYINMSFLKPQNGIQFRPKKIQMLYEYDSLGQLNRISEVDANYNKNGESIEIYDNYRNFQIRSYFNNISVVLVNRLRNISILNLNFTGDRYDLIINNDYNNYRTVREIHTYKNSSNELNNFNLVETIKVRKNGKVKGAKANSKLIF